MAKPQSPNKAYAENVTVLAGAVALGEGALQKVLGGEETSTQINGETQETRDIQELLASRLGKILGA